MADLEKRLLSDIELKPYIWWRYIILRWEHGEQSLKLFLERINSIHPKIKFTADWSSSSVNFLNVKVVMKDGKIIKDFFDQRCNKLEHWLHERGYSERVVRQEILRARKIPRAELSEKERNHLEEN